MMFTVTNEVNLLDKTECIVVGLYEDGGKSSGIFSELDNAFSGQLKELLSSGDISSKKKELSKIHTLQKIGAKRILFVGLGKEKEMSLDLLREVFGKMFKEVKSSQLTEVTIFLDSFITDKIENVDLAHVLGEALPLATYEFAGYKTNKKDERKEIEKCIVVTKENSEEIHSALTIGFVYGKATNSARNLVNRPGNKLTATDLADYGKQLAEKYGFEITVLEKEDMERLGMGALLAVNKGSTEPPKMIVLKYQGKADWKDVIGLVGKGITFDTGGYSLKPKDGIVGMKSDMGGAAAVLGAMEIIGELRPEQNILAVIPSTDNMVSGHAFKPDDVITSLSGKTIEVLNTDAEGRLVLADAITYAKQLGANYLVDVATLTGGVIVALGTETTGALTNNEDWFEQVLLASMEAGEPIWRLPLFQRDIERIRDSKIADLNNSPGREGHAIMGGGFIGEFAEDTPWVHLDIAGTATTKKNGDLGPAGATGVMTRTLALLVEKFEPLN